MSNPSEYVGKHRAIGPHEKLFDAMPHLTSTADTNQFPCPLASQATPRAHHTAQPTPRNHCVPAMAMINAPDVPTSDPVPALARSFPPFVPSIHAPTAVLRYYRQHSQ